MMTDLPPPLAYASAPDPEPRRFRPTALLAWVVIVGVCVALPLLRAEGRVAAPTTLPTTSPATSPAAPAAGERVGMQTELAGRMWVGMVRLVTGTGDDQARKQLETFVGLPQETETDRMATAVALAEVGERRRAAALIDRLDDPDAAELRERYAADGPGPASRPASPRLRQRLGWFAKLSDVHGLPDTDPARAAVLAEAKRSAVVVVAAFLLACGAFVVGLGLFVTAIVLFALGRLRFAVGRPRGPAHVYAEAAAVYLGGFVLVSLLIAKLLPDAPMKIHVLGLGGVVVLAAVWPLLRGVRFGVQRQDWGIHTGRGVVVEMLSGVGGYLAGLPVVGVGLVITIILLQLTHVVPTHPIQQQGNAPLTLYLIASVFAPLTEELLFRGALVSHLRAGVNAVLAAGISGLVFAAVHPQGWTVVPALAAIGAVLALVRQWRGSLVASVTAHALHNGVLVTVMVLATR